MSGLEIERKFLVRKGDAYQRAAFASSHIQQGYIRCEDATVRVRVRDDKAYLTIKSRSVDGGLSRYEFEKEITLDEASHLLKLCRGGVIDKRRWLVKSGIKPDFIGPEVTGDYHFYNKQMLVNPYSKWKQIVPEEYR